jgi:hypothetical protein
MYVAPDNIKDGIANEWVLVGAHSMVEFSSKRMCLVRGNIEDHIRNECL